MLCTSGPLASWSVLDLPSVHMLELSGLGKLLEAPHRLRHLVGLGLTTSTSVRMVECIHGHTSDLGSEPSVTASTSFTPGSGLVLLVGHNAQSGVALHVHVPVLTRTQPHNDFPFFGVFRQQSGESARSFNQLATPVGMQTDVVDHRADWQHV